MMEFLTAFLTAFVIILTAFVLFFVVVSAVSLVFSMFMALMDWIEVNVGDWAVVLIGGSLTVAIFAFIAAITLTFGGVPQ